LIAISVRSWAGNQVGGAQHVEELLPRDPLPLADDFCFDERDVRGGTAETDGAQFEEKRCQFAKTTGEGSGCRLRRSRFLRFVHAPRKPVGFSRKVIQISALEQFRRPCVHLVGNSR
jgi:hypothetical protein